MASHKLLDMLTATAEICGARTFSQPAATLMLTALSRYPEESVITALERCTLECRNLTLADIISRIEDGHPGVEEAWSMLPQSENESVVWTDQMRESFEICSRQIPDDPIAARMAFKESYSKLLSEARSRNIRPRWQVSFGFDPNSRVAAIQKAVDKKRITQEEAQQLLPTLSHSSIPNHYLKITGNKEEEIHPNVLKIREIIHGVFHENPDERIQELETQHLIKKAKEQIKRIGQDDESIK